MHSKRITRPLLEVITAALACIALFMSVRALSAFSDFRSAKQVAKSQPVTSPDNAWISEANRLIAQIEQDYAIWNREYHPIRQTVVDQVGKIDPYTGAAVARAINAFPSAEGRRAAESVRRGLNDLVRQIGCCLLPDCDDCELISRAPEICSRYRAHLAVAQGLSLEAQARLVVAQNVDELRTINWYAAWEAISERVEFNEFYVVFCHGPVPLSPRARDYLYMSVRKWWDTQGPVLVWSAEKGKLVRCNSEPVSRALPASRPAIPEGAAANEVEPADEWAQSAPRVERLPGLPLPFSVDRLHQIDGEDRPPLSEEEVRMLLPRK